jgi:hypothetical protein
MCGSANRACHVISANQNTDSARRFIVYMCASHNGQHGVILNIRGNATTFEFEESCKCGTFD